MTKKDVLVTGGSRGIGLTITHQLLEKGFRVMSTTRRTPFKSTLNKYEGFTGITCDQEILDDLAKVDGTLVKYEVKGSAVEWEAPEPREPSARESTSAAAIDTSVAPCSGSSQPKASKR